MLPTSKNFRFWLLWLMLRTTLSKPPNSIVWRITPRSALNGFITFTVVSLGYLLRSKSV
ncbi:Uncharacterised protein [Segatella copri]|nr:Uncharacterised protein [Segatella copri]